MLAISSNEDYISSKFRVLFCSQISFDSSVNRFCFIMAILSKQALSSWLPDPSTARPLVYDGSDSILSEFPQCTYLISNPKVTLTLCQSRNRVGRFLD